MPCLLIIAHAPLASCLRTVAIHVYPEVAGRIRSLDVEADADPAEVEACARRLIAEGADETLVLVDVFGATPSNVAQRLFDAGSIRLVTGVNVPMLWRTACYLDEPLDALAQRAVLGASNGVMQVAMRRPQAQSPSLAPHAQDPNPHQQ